MPNKKYYTQEELDACLQRARAEYDSALMQKRERIDELKTELAEAEKKIADFNGQRELIYKAITVAIKKAEDIERVSLIRYNQEIAQLKSFHDKWVGYYNRIIEKYPLTDELIAASKINGRIAEVLSKTGDIDAQYESERARLSDSIKAENDSAEPDTVAVAAAAVKDDYKDRSPAGFSISEALHPKDDLKDIMRELGIIIDDQA